MSQDVNVVCLTGRLTRDPELRSTPGGTTVLDLGLAVNERRRNRQTDQWEDYANFVDCTMFGDRAEALSRILRKGMQVSVSGSLRWESWERDGQRRSRLSVIAREVVLPPRQQAAGADAGQIAAARQAYSQGPQPAPTDAYDDEIPF